MTMTTLERHQAPAAKPETSLLASMSPEERSYFNNAYPGAGTVLAHVSLDGRIRVQR